MIIFYIFFYLLLFLVTLLLIVLSVPLEYSFEGRKYDSLAFHGGIYWPFKSLGISVVKDIDTPMRLQLTFFRMQHILPLPSFNQPKKKKDKKHKVKDKKKPRKSIEKDFFNVEVIKKALGVVHRFLNQIKPKDFSLSLRLGMEDPYYIGLLYGFLYLLAMISNNIRITPVFNENILEGECKIQGRIVFMTFIIMFFQFVLSSPVRKIIFKKRRKKHGI